MLISRPFPSSAHSLPSPDGRLIATLHASVVSIRAVQTLGIVKTIRLPQHSSGCVLCVQWSPSSRRLLVGSVDRIWVFSLSVEQSYATIRHSPIPGSKPGHITFAASDDHVCIFSSHGLKLGIFHLTRCKVVEIGNPKFYTASTAEKTLSSRPRTGHLAVLTRTAGKDMVSLHGRPSLSVRKSWAPDTIDAQGLTWSPEGRWLIIWESAAHGHKLLFHTPDGQLFKTWTGPTSVEGADGHGLGAGIKTLRFSADCRKLAVGDSSRSVCMLDMSSLAETSVLPHPKSITPMDSLQVWQEHVTVSQTGSRIHTFRRATQPLSPTTSPGDDGLPKSGCMSIHFDATSALLATQLEDSPTTVWIWDLQASDLRAALLFHRPVTTLSWHPTLGERLVIECEGQQYTGIAFVWHPLTEGPRTLDLAHVLSPGSVTGKSRAAWLPLDPSGPASLFLSDSQNYVLASLADQEEGIPPWERNAPAAGRESSPELVPASTPEESLLEVGDGDDDDDGSELEDTFIHKRWKQGEEESGLNS